MKQHRVLNIFAIFASLCSAIAQTTKPAAPTQPPAPQTVRPPSLHDFSASLESLTRHVNRAVVQIFSEGYGLEESESGSNTSLITKQSSTGSGVLLSADGFIVTNAHVVQNSRRVEVLLSASVRGSLAGHSRRKRLEGTIVGIDRVTDLAVLKVDATALPFLQFADARRLRQGQLALAFGNPLGLENSVSMGVVSSVARQIHPDDAMSYIQTDAPINPGNSGGPLVDADGHILGINTFIYTQSGGSEGIGFAIPGSIAQNVTTQIRKSGHVHRGQIGVFAQTVTPAIATGLDLEQDWGVILADVYPDGPADKAGLKPADIVTNIDDQNMDDARQFQVYLYSRPIGHKMNVSIRRGTEKLNFTVKVIEQEDDPQRFADMVNVEENIIRRLGILGITIDKKVAEMFPDLRRQYGVVVAARSADAPVTSGGLHPGDVIYSLNATPTASVAALRAELDKLKPGDSGVLHIERDGKLRYIVFQLE